MKHRRKHGWQVWSYEWANLKGPIPKTVLFGGKTFATRREAEAAWYDTVPGPNDKATYIRFAKVAGVSLS